jgi:hypothetical protein
MEFLHLLIRHTNRYERNADPSYRAAFFDATTGEPVTQPEQRVMGRSELKRFLEDEVGKTAVSADDLLSTLEEEGSIELRDVALRQVVRFSLA